MTRFLGAPTHSFFCGTQASHCRGLSRCGAQAPDAQAQRPWLTGPAAARPVGFSRTGARTRVPCIGRRTLSHCAPREALNSPQHSLLTIFPSLCLFPTPLQHFLGTPLIEMTCSQIFVLGGGMGRLRGNLLRQTRIPILSTASSRLRWGGTLGADAEDDF